MPQSLHIIKNFDELATTPQRRNVLEIIEAGLAAIQPQNLLKKEISLEANTLKVKDKTFDLTNFERIFVIGFGKGSAEVVKYLGQVLGDKLTAA